MLPKKTFERGGLSSEAYLAIVSDRNATRKRSLVAGQSLVSGSFVAGFSVLVSGPVVSFG